LSEVTQQQPLVYVVVLNWNNAPDTIECLGSLLKSDYQSFVPLVVDNGSTNGSVEKIRAEFPTVAIVELDENLGYAAGNNVGIRHALTQAADYVMVLNNDTYVAPSMLSELINFAQSKQNVGMLGPKMYCADLNDTLFAAGSFIEWRKGRTYNRGMFQQASDVTDSVAPEPVDYITGCGVLVSKEFVESAGDLDPVYFLNYEDVDWGFKAWRYGFEVWYVPEAIMWHKVSGTLGQASPANTYYMTRNGLFFFWKNSPAHLRLLAITSLIARTLRSIIAWTIKPRFRNEEYRKLRSANLHALRDFILGNFGQMKSDFPSRNNT
jgi:GT2 family glycosyltransferase